MQKLNLLFHKTILLLLNILDINLDISDQMMILVVKLQQLLKQQVPQKTLQSQNQLQVK